MKYDDNEFEENSEMEMTDEQYEDFVRRNEEMDFHQLDFAYRDLDQKLLCRAIKMLEKSFFWRFRKNDTKLKLVFETYHTLKSILIPEDEE